MTNIPEHSGERLESLTKEELIRLLEYRVKHFIDDWLRGKYDCPPNRIDPIAKIVEVLNAASGVDYHPAHRDGIVNISIAVKK